MSKIFRIPIALLSLTVFADLCTLVSAQAIEFGRFDNMAVLDQAEFIAVMVDQTQNALVGAGQANDAAKIEQLFTTIEPGDKMSLGLVELESNVDRARVADADRATKDPNARRLDVEDALFVTLKKNNILMTTSITNAVTAALAHFHALTDAQFEAKSADEQRRYIALLAKIGYPDAMYRQEVEALQKGQKTTNDPEMTKLELEILAQEFPHQLNDQPGFADVASAIRAEYATAPNAAGPMYAVVIHLMDLQKAELKKEMKRMENDTYHLPFKPDDASPATRLPLTQPASPSVDDDDPIGGGGFITPPSQSNGH
jgi:hypothetical protein